jgi:hypothetical protein
VYYFWGLQQEESGVVLPDGRPLPPRWYIRDMLWQVGAGCGVGVFVESEVLVCCLMCVAMHVPVQFLL